MVTTMESTDAFAAADVVRLYPSINIVKCVTYMCGGCHAPWLIASAEKCARGLMLCLQILAVEFSVKKWIFWKY